MYSLKDKNGIIVKKGDLVKLCMYRDKYRYSPGMLKLIKTNKPYRVESIDIAGGYIVIKGYYWESHSIIKLVAEPTKPKIVLFDPKNLFI